MKGCECVYCKKEFPNKQSYMEHTKLGCRLKTDYVLELEAENAKLKEEVNHLNSLDKLAKDFSGVSALEAENKALKEDLDMANDSLGKRINNLIEDNKSFALQVVGLREALKLCEKISLVEGSENYEVVKKQLTALNTPPSQLAKEVEEKIK